MADNRTTVCDKTDITDIISDLINNYKIEEVKDSISTRNKWKRAAYIFDILNKLFSMFSILVSGAVIISQDIHITYAALCTQTMAVAFIGFNNWCAKKYSEQAVITNAIYDSLKTGKMPIVNIASVAAEKDTSTINVSSIPPEADETKKDSA